MHFTLLNNNPLVSVIIPVFNGEKFLLQALLSILNQSYDDLEVVVVDDGSSDNSIKIIESIKDDRIVLIKNGKNRGIAFSLNKGIYASRGELIARMDADDIALPDRIQKQVNFLQNNSDIGIIGTAYYHMDASGHIQKKIHPPETDVEIRCSLLFMSPFAHPTVMMRREVIDRFFLRYAENLKFAQDYQLWSDVLEHTKGANLPAPLLKYRCHEESISTSKKSRQKNIGHQIRKDNLYKYMEKKWVDGLNLDCIVDIVSGGTADWSKQDLVTSYTNVIAILTKFFWLKRLQGNEIARVRKQIIHPLISNMIFQAFLSGEIKAKERVEMLVFILKEAWKYGYYPSSRGILNKFKIIRN